MFNTLVKSLEIDITYTVNSFFNVLQKFPILKDLITDDIYSSKIIKKVVKLFMLLFYIVRAISIKFFYFFLIFSISYYLLPNALVKTYFHVYFTLTILGMFINNKLLNTNKKKYISLILFNMDSNDYYKKELLWNLFSNLILNTICIFFFGYLIKSPIIYSISLILFTLFIRIIGETLNIMFYKKKKYIWYSNTKLYFLVFIICIAIGLLPYLNIYVYPNSIIILTIITILLGIPCFIYLLKLKDYKLIYKKLSSVVDPMNSKHDKDYLRQAMVSVRDKDKIIDNKKLIGKKGYDLFNTIFFERHKEILLRSAKKFSFIIIVVYAVIAYLVINDKNTIEPINNFLHNNLGWFVIVMYFINRGAIITQAMFFNCDHAMLSYNFYREPKTILGLFKKRLITLVKVNLLPASLIGVGNIILLILTNKYNYLLLVTTFLFIILVSIFFSVHYLVIYYLLQPFNKNLEVKKVSYSFVTFITYFISYQLTSITFNSLYFSIIGLIATIIYIIIGLLLVYRLAPKTFKLN